MQNVMIPFTFDTTFPVDTVTLMTDQDFRRIKESI